MKHLIVYAHPRTDSFNNAILNTAVTALEAEGHEVVVRDLYQLGFQPVLTEADTTSMRAGQTPQDIATEQQYVTDADAITFIYPIWWTGLPAILKGYVDRVFAYGFAYASGAAGIEKLLTGKKGLMISTHGTPKDVYDQVGMTNALKLTSDTGIFDFVGIEPVDHLLFGAIGYLDAAAYQAMLDEVKQTVTTRF
ncbi:NAD(P)H-dependent oxidoreductase [Paenibacillus barcinonensis]|uniref:NAD(P)H dehydrogenase (Quinone) n=1 Tax=Paenibacillus barcinonensis TaxID=198119 RepID=A0A2V4UQP0_PAEBA|nr:NAD(P)H-dependent oxidoreductase [Paenibacillus barcinonensis]PYE42403.1 NAD(P)H dehydrogenase (quinone) [Paenibacillus barcinonensis]QKS58357.1 NAD(P)H-dependent oxidoreductase [Paenibacillus barcinonensis]